MSAGGPKGSSQSAAPAQEQSQRFARTPKPPYFVVVFTLQRTSDGAGYRETAAEMFRLATAHPGCLGMETAQGADGFGITVAYFSDQASLDSWRNHPSHRAAQELGKSRWYEHYELRVGVVERAYAGPPDACAAE